jgi:RNA polymerase sigma-70 factor, ECF subfamily
MIMQIDSAVPHVATWDLDAIPVSRPSDTQIVKLIAQGDKDAMRVLFARYKVWVYRFALRLINNEATAEDLVSETFLEVWRHAGRFEGRSQVSTWLLAITRNLALSTLRCHSPEQLDNGIAELIEDDADDPESSLHKVQRGSALVAGLTSSTNRRMGDREPTHRRF